MLLGPILNSLFGKAFIKNLLDSVERRTSIINQCNTINLDYEIAETVDGTKCVPPSYVVQHGRFLLQYPASAGFYGNQLTTIKILENAITNNLPSYIALDDDCIFEHTLNLSEDNYKQIKNNLPEDWDIVIFGRMGLENVQNTTVKYVKATACPDAAGSHGIAIRSTVYESLLTICKEMKYWGDGTIGNLIDISKNVYIIEPSLCYQNRKLFSDINKMYH